jgi:hypothetical protein
VWLDKDILVYFFFCVNQRKSGVLTIEVPLQFLYYCFLSFPFSGNILCHVYVRWHAHGCDDIDITYVGMHMVVMTSTLVHVRTSKKHGFVQTFWVRLFIHFETKKLFRQIEINSCVQAFWFRTKTFVQTFLFWTSAFNFVCNIIHQTFLITCWWIKVWVSKQDF